MNVDCQRCVNLYPEIDEMQTGKEKEIASLVQRPGLVKRHTLGSGPIRGIYQASNGRVFAVSGQNFYEFTIDAVTDYGALLDSTAGRVSMTDDGTDLVLVDGLKGYHFTFDTDTFAEITDTEFPTGADVVQFFDQYLIVNEPGTMRFWWTDTGAANWDGLDFASAEGNPDELLTLLVDHRELWLFGTESIEVFFNTGDADLPFQRREGTLIESGIAAINSVCQLDNTPAWVSRDKNGAGMIVRGVGYNPKRISTHAVEQAIKGYGDISGASAYTYQIGGHHFAAFNFPGADRTWVYDATTELWHEETYTLSDGTMSRHRIEHHCFDGQRHWAGDFQNGNLYTMEESVYTDDGQMISFLRRNPHTSAGGRRIFTGSFQLDMETGTANSSGAGSDPKIMLRYSKDGGHRWSNEKWRGLGKVGEYKKRVIWRRLGSSRDLVIEVRCTEPIKQVWISGLFEMEAGAS